ncbi:MULTISPECIES: glycoside hydrolase family 2 protein [Glycomyces]|uniref:Beta-galactosidase n=2 Tax=Glycomyces TaxID=58113 RepID=A0A9X3SY83_9ACTN|nr:glycoside hydrolase family 2 TIM barrel-domain containing protein [Glycomyces lechevalierae]MDA1385966.1 discoidin domain-containing protein [Glycomyces lechevalierae]MDR7340877.1 beta-galactosidase [Glycomyces lechevalierae]
MIREQRFINDDWTFAYGEHPGAESEPPHPPRPEAARHDAAWYDIGLPHSFDLPDFREQRFYVGHGCYRRTVTINPEWTGQWIALEFLGVFQACEVFVNGRPVGRHEGGYTPFTVDISDAVVAGANEVFVRVDNLWNPRLAPRAGDYSFAGGIYRDVSLIVADRVRIDWYGIGVTTPDVGRERATVAASVEVVNDEPHPVQVDVAAVIADPGRTVAALPPVTRTIPARSRAVVELEGAVARPILWHPDQPHRYRLTASVSVEGTARDSQQTAFGIRSFEFTADRGFFLNGEHLDLHGVNVHQNRGGWGDAGTRASIRRDVAMVKDLGMNIIRGSHYPHHPFFAEECDRQGLLFWSELHFWGIGGEDVEGYWFASAYPVEEADEPAFEESLRRALREMVRTHRNHPSIVTWSIGNEAFFSDDKVIDKAKRLTGELVELARELDPTRPVAVGGAQRKGFDRLGDIAGYNGDGAELFHDPGIPNVVSEYHGVRGQGPGEYEVEWEHGVEVDYPWRSGKIFWCAFHYKSIADGAGLQGLADYWRRPRRPYHWYRERLRGIAPPEFPKPGWAVALRLSSDVDTIPTDGTGDVRIEVELVDTRGVRVVDDRAVTLTVVEGEGVFPSGRSITLAPETHSLWGGAGAIELRSYVPGVQRIRATADGLVPAELVAEAVGERKAPRARRLPPPAPSVAEPPRGQGKTSLAAYRPVSVSSAEPRFEGGNATSSGSGTFWRAANRDPGEWITAHLEFPYEISRIEVVFAEAPAHPWAVETSADGQRFEPLHRGEPGADSLSVHLDFPARPASRVRIAFPQQPIDIEEIRVY